MTDPLDAALERAVAGHYALERALTADGATAVFLARDLRLERPVALNVLPFAPDPGARARFMSRATLASRLAHPNIVPIHEVNDQGGLAWYVSSFVHGRSLASRLRADGPLPPTVAAQMARELAWALAYAHEQGLVHGALGPAHVFLEDGTGRAVITGFGTARQTDSTDPTADLRDLATTLATALRGNAPADPAEVAAALAQLPPWAATPLAGLVAPRSFGPPATAQQIAESMTPPVRPEIPPVLRDWLAARNPLRVVLMTWSFVHTTLWLLNSGGTVDTYINVTWSPWLLSWPVAILQLRKVLRAGFGPADVLGVLDQRLRIRQEEMGDRRPRRGTKAVTWAVLAVLLGVGATMVDPVRLAHNPLAHFLFIVIGLLLVATLYRAWRPKSAPERPRDELMEQRVALWHGPLGRLTFRLAGLGLPRRSGAPSAFDQRPTTVILADSVRELARSLPKSLLKQFPDVQATVDRLDRAAEALRARVQRLEAVADGGAVPAAALKAARERHADAVVALETVRLALLAAQGGVADIGAATRELEDALAVAERMQQVAAAKDEIAAEMGE